MVGLGVGRTTSVTPATLATPTLSGGAAGFAVYLLRSFFERAEVPLPIHSAEPVRSLCNLDEEIIGLPESQLRLLLIGILLGVSLGPLVDRLYHLRRYFEYSASTWTPRNTSSNRPVWLAATP